VQTVAIDILQGVSAEQFFGKFFRVRPFVIRGQLTHWTALRLWSPSYLKEQFGRATIKVSLYDSDLPETFLDQTISFVHKTMVLGDYVDTLQASPDSRFVLREDHKLFEEFPQMLSELAYFSPFCSNKSASTLKYRSLWLGPPNYSTGLHSDPGDTLLFQIFGHKRVLLYDPEQAKYLYQQSEESVLDRASRLTPKSTINESYLKVLVEQVGWCEVNPFNANLVKFPLFENATAIEAFLGPGDTLYIPDRWWHAVRSLEATISVSIEPTFDGLLFAARTEK
jgi:ribosomal protein L16 Arg81 hydroxylase